MLKKLKTISITILSIIAIVLVGYAGFIITKDYYSNKDQVTVKIDKTVIIKEVRQISKLETVKQIMQRDIEVTLDLGDLEVFGWSLLEKKHTRKVAVTGDITAGIDLAKIREGDIILSEDKKTLTINLPAPEILGVNIMEDKTNIVNDDLTFLFKLNNLSAEKRVEAEDELSRQIMKSQKTALIDGACQKDSSGKNVLNFANENVKKTAITGLFGKLIFDEIIINTTESTICEFGDYRISE